MYYNRTITPQIEANLDNPLILVITGGRQTGKTTLLNHFYEREKTKRACYFINLENPTFLDLLNEHPENIFKITNLLPQKQQMVFIDEIQYLDNPTNFLKYLYDEYHGNLKLIVSGSSSFYIDHKFKDSLMGRKRLFALYTLNFKEFLTFKRQTSLLKEIIRQENISLLQEKYLWPLFSEYITYGGYPSVVLQANEEEKKYLLSEMALDYIKKDIFEAGIQDQSKYFQLLKILAHQIGSLVNANELANTLGLASTTIEKYLYVMQKSYQLALIRPYYSNIRKELTKMPKAYFYDSGLRNMLMDSFDNIELRMDKGSYLENIVFRELLFHYPLDRIRFWRTQNKNEIDFVIQERKAIEVKFQAAECRPSKYQRFITAYPQIDFSFMTYNDALSMSLDVLK